MVLSLTSPLGPSIASSLAVSLDTALYNQGTSAMDALWAGLPLVSLPLDLSVITSRRSLCDVWHRRPPFAEQHLQRTDLKSSQSEDMLLITLKFRSSRREARHPTTYLLWGCES